MDGTRTIRKVLTAALALAILLWAEAGLALVPGDQIAQCRAMIMHGHAQSTAAMQCCPAIRTPALALAANHPPCCSVSGDAERPIGFVVGSERATAHSLDSADSASWNFAPQVAEPHGKLRGADAPHFVRPVLELKSDLRI
jgi:hypothetical protein